MKNILVYPLYKIKGRESEYEKHKYFVNKNIEIVNKLNCVDSVLVFSKEVENWNQMIAMNLLTIQRMTEEGYNVLFSEADTIFLKEFSEIYSLDKMTLFSKCNGGSQLDLNLKEGYYLNSGLVYYPSNLNQSIWNHAKTNMENTSISWAGCNFEVLTNRMFYSQFKTMDEGIDYLHKIGISRYNWRGLVAEREHSSSMMPDIDNIHHVHFLNMSEYIHNLPHCQPFWYTDFFNNLYKAVKINNEDLKKSTIKDILYYYLNSINWGSRIDAKQRLLKYAEVF